MSIRLMIIASASSVFGVACDSKSPASSEESHLPIAKSSQVRIGSESASAVPPDSARTGSLPPFVGTAGIIDKTVPSGVAELSSVRVGRHAGFVRTVFEFKDGVFPGYHLEYVDRPVRRCGSGEVAELAGDGWLEVRLSPAQAHTEQGHPTTLPLERKEEIGVLREMELTCDFEAVVTWVLGVSSPNRYRVLELSAPSRLAVDILSP